jgi:MoaA/NifB/PqqE/SkfB family radical SAM enzyme
MKKTKLPKGQYEEQVELVKNMLESGSGIIEVMTSTSLNEEEVLKINDECIEK